MSCLGPDRCMRALGYTYLHSNCPLGTELIVELCSGSVDEGDENASKNPHWRAPTQSHLPQRISVSQVSLRISSCYRVLASSGEQHFPWWPLFSSQMPWNRSCGQKLHVWEKMRNLDYYTFEVVAPAQHKFNRWQLLLKIARSAPTRQWITNCPLRNYIVFVLTLSRHTFLKPKRQHPTTTKVIFLQETNYLPLTAFPV